jgi:hypothetical protein
MTIKESPGFKWIFLPFILVIIIVLGVFIWTKSQQLSARMIKERPPFQPIPPRKPEFARKPEIVITPPRQETLRVEVEHEPEAYGQILPEAIPAARKEKVIHPQHYFHLRNGKSLKTLDELYHAISQMSDDEFKHHVNPSKNDFANWIAHILERQELASQLFRIKSKEGTLGLIKDELRK